MHKMLHQAGVPEPIIIKGITNRSIKAKTITYTLENEREKQQNILSMEEKPLTDKKIYVSLLEPGDWTSTAYNHHTYTCI